MESWILALSSSPWVYPALTGFAIIDGFFPPIPSESAVIALAAQAKTSGAPNLLLVILFAAVDAWCGDQIAYQIGSMVNPRTLRIPVSYTHLRAHETVLDLVCRLLLEKKKQK